VGTILDWESLIAKNTPKFYDPGERNQPAPITDRRLENCNTFNRAQQAKPISEGCLGAIASLEPNFDFRFWILDFGAIAGN
jgi:hypothetical protein